MFLYLFHVYEIMDVSELISRGQQHNYTKHTPLDHSEQLLLDPPAQYYSRGAERH